MKCAFAMASLTLALFSTPKLRADTPRSDTLEEQAAQHFEQATRHLRSRDFDRAIPELERAQELLPHPRVLYNLGFAYLAVERRADAHRAFTSFVALNPRETTAVDRKRVRAQLEQLKAQVSPVRLLLEPSEAELVLDGRAISSAGPLVLDPGAHVLTAVAAGYETGEFHFDTEAGQALALVVRLRASAPEHKTETQKTVESQPAVLEKPAVLSPQLSAHPRASPPVPRPATSMQQSRSALPWALAAGGAGLGALLVAGVLGADNANRYATWRTTQRALEQRRLDPNDSQLAQDQRTNDDLANSIHLRDQVVIGLAAGGAVSLLAGVGVYFLGKRQEARFALSADPRGRLAFMGHW